MPTDSIIYNYGLQLRVPQGHEFLLLFTMASKIPAFSFHQKQVLRQPSNTWAKAGISEQTARLPFPPSKLTCHPKTRFHLNGFGLPRWRVTGDNRQRRRGCKAPVNGQALQTDMLTSAHNPHERTRIHTFAYIVPLRCARALPPARGYLCQEGRGRAHLSQGSRAFAETPYLSRANRHIAELLSVT